MPGIGDYIHFRTENYQRFGTLTKNNENESNYGSAGSVINSQIANVKNKMATYNKRTSSYDLEDFLNKLFYPENTNEQDNEQFEELKQSVNQMFEEKFAGFKIDWGTLGVRTSTKGLIKESASSIYGSRLNKISAMIDSLSSGAKSKETLAKAAQAQLAIQELLQEAKTTPKGDTKVNFNDDNRNLIGTINAAVKSLMYNQLAVGQIFEYALSCLSYQIQNKVGKVSLDMITALSNGVNGVQRRTMAGGFGIKPILDMSKVDSNYFDGQIAKAMLPKGWSEISSDGFFGYEFSMPTDDKVDVNFDFNDELFKISAKNYKDPLHSGIHIVSGTSLLAMLLDADTSVDFVNHYLNITSSNPGDSNLIESAHRAIKLTILLKALTGYSTSGASGEADTLVVNSRMTRHIYVRSMGEIMNMISNQIDNLDSFMHVSGFTDIHSSFVGSKDWPNIEASKVRITKLLMDLHAQKISVSLKNFNKIVAGT